MKVVAYRYNASFILNEFYNKPKDSNSHAEKLRVIETAAKLIHYDVRQVNQAKDVNPYTGEMSSVEDAISFLPESLHTLLQCLFVGKIPKGSWHH